MARVLRTAGYSITCSSKPRRCTASNKASESGAPGKGSWCDHHRLVGEPLPSGSWRPHIASELAHFHGKDAPALKKACHREVILGITPSQRSGRSSTLAPLAFAQNEGALLGTRRVHALFETALIGVYLVGGGTMRTQQGAKGAAGRMIESPYQNPRSPPRMTGSL